mmetsp:Transcript_32977/g.56373  ORF Transcript_32977/g.56373 Transcript_32977/m.56373 type:complete len:140 (-) Transcript_32977:31-450(-)
MNYTPAKKRKLNSEYNQGTQTSVSKTYFDFEEEVDQDRKSYSLEDGTVEVLNVLQTKGKITLKELSEQTDVPYRRSSDILNVLKTTPLLARNGSKRIDPYIFCANIPLNETINLKTIEDEIAKEKEKIKQLQTKLKEKN